ncbi:hypothetical protein BI317_05505 [Xanthomonas hortorum pv. gardneri]|nr:hypothetical protein BI317_05505 [Xanthomonas hortorum pv. gardneri]
MRRGRSKARAPMARKLCLLAPTGEGLSQLAQYRVQTPRSHSNEVPRRQRGWGLAESGTGMCRGGESDRMSDRAEEPVRGRAAAPCRS